MCILTLYICLLQQKYQREIEKLEKDNRGLRKQLIMLKGDTVAKPRHIRVCNAW
jgi:hypothetical protein